MRPDQRIKQANSKGKLARAVVVYRAALAHYANEAHWAVKEEAILWVGDDDPTKVAEMALYAGKRKPPPPQELRTNVLKK